MRMVICILMHAQYVKINLLWSEDFWKFSAFTLKKKQLPRTHFVVFENVSAGFARKAGMS